MSPLLRGLTAPPLPRAGDNEETRLALWRLRDSASPLAGSFLKWGKGKGEVFEEDGGGVNFLVFFLIDEVGILF